LATLLLISALSVANKLPQEKGKTPLIISKGRIPQLPPGASVMAGYIKIQNLNVKAIILVKFSSPQFTTVEVHRTIHKNNILTMQKQAKITIRPQSTIELKPGGFHFMLINPTQDLKKRQIIIITGETDKQKKYKFKLVVSPLGEHHPHHHKH